MVFNIDKKCFSNKSAYQEGFLKDHMAHDDQDVQN